MGEEKELRILFEIMNKSRVPQSDFEAKKEVFGSPSTISKILRKLEKEGLLHRHRFSKEPTAYPINVWSLRTDYQSFKQLVKRFLGLSGKATKWKREFLGHVYLWKGLDRFRNKVDLPFFSMILYAFTTNIFHSNVQAIERYARLDPLNQMLKISFFYKEMVNRIIGKTKKEGLFLPEKISNLLLSLYFRPTRNEAPAKEKKEWCDNLVNEPYTIHLTFSEIEIDCLRTLMRLSTWVSNDFLLRLIDGHSYKKMRNIEGSPYIGKNKSVIEELVRQVKTSLWLHLFYIFEIDARKGLSLSDRQAYEDFKAILGNKLNFRTEIGLKGSKEIDLGDFKDYEGIFTESSIILYSHREHFFCEGPFDSSLCDLDKIDSSILFVIENQRLFMNNSEEQDLIFR